jgi:AAA+ ATPase superfamily predicted ATPase
VISKFVNRENELNLLEEEWRKKYGRLIILYGRRRIGKTRLLMEFAKDKKGIFYIAEDTSAGIQINTLKEKIADFLRDSLLKSLEIKSWDQLFEYLAKNMPEDRFYLIIDEFTYLIKSDRRILSVLQKLWDTKFADSPIFIILSGSMLGLMSEAVLSYTSPLYGRRTRDILLEELKFRYAKEIVGFPFSEAVELYMTVGGIPEYLLKASEYSSIKEFLAKEFFSKWGYFYREPYFIISQEFKELRTYFSILNAIAYGNTKPGEIANFVGVESRKIYPYLENLIRFGFVERITPAFGKRRSRGIYIIKDAMFDFWFNLVFKHREEIEAETFKPDEHDLSAYYGKRFEVFVREQMLPHILPGYKLGKWWYKHEEIDIVAFNEKAKEVWFIECKWSDLGKMDVKRIIKELERRSELVKIDDGKWTKRYGVVARNVTNKEDVKCCGVVLDLDDFRKKLDDQTNINQD